MAHQTMTTRTRVSPKSVLKSVGPFLVPFLKTVALYFIVTPNLASPSIWMVLFKCAPIVSLMAFVLLHGINLTEAYSYSRRILVGLVFCCLGDACLVYPDLFLHGLLSFAVGHCCYAAAFGFHPPRWEIFPLLFGTGALFYSYIYPGLGQVLCYLAGIYVALIAVMLWRAVARVELFDDLWTWTKLCSCAGAILFCISDMCLAVDRFVMPMDWALNVIMITYYAAQCGITLSVVDSHVDAVVREEELPAAVQIANENEGKKSVKSE